MAITGFVEYADSASVTGWAYDSDSPSARLEITVRVGDQFCASGFADIHRSDLSSVGMGDGTHGFTVDLREANISAEDAAGLTVHAISGAVIVELPYARGKSQVIADLISTAGQPTADAGQFPVFILGPARSGTSAITLALLESAAYVGTGEGHLMPLAQSLLAAVDRHYERTGSDPNTLRGRVSIQAFQKLVRRSFVQLARDLFPSVRWLDKTPTVEMVRAAPLMKELWPNARFVFMKRRVIENVMSRRRKFPHEATDRHYSDWAAVMEAWLAVRDGLGSAALEVEHRQLVLDPRAQAEAISQFLQLSEAASARFTRCLMADRPEQTDERFGATYALDQLGLSEDDAQHLIAACDGVMAAYGYSFDEAYFA